MTVNQKTPVMTQVMEVISVKIYRKSLSSLTAKTLNLSRYAFFLFRCYACNYLRYENTESNFIQRVLETNLLITRDRQFHIFILFDVAMLLFRVVYFENLQWLPVQC